MSRFFSYGQKIVVYFGTASKVSVFGVILVNIFPYSDWLRRDTPYLSVFSPNAGKYGSKYGHFLRSVVSILYISKEKKTK